MSAGSITDEHREQADSIIERFESISAKSDSAMGDPGSWCYQGKHASVDPDLTRDLLVQMESNLLPQLRQHIITLNELLDPADLCEEPTTRLNLISEIQSRLGGTSGQIISANRNIWSNYALVGLDQFTDQHLNESKVFRICNMHGYLTHSFQEAFSDVCDGHCTVILVMGLSQTEHDIAEDVSEARKHVLEATDTLFEAIERAINWLKGSELDNIQLAWTKERSEIDSILKKYLGFVDRRSDSNDQLQLEPSDHEQMLKLAKLVIPIIKLYRLFMDKLSERGMNRKQLIPKFTTLCTAELDALVDLPYGANSKLCEILNILRGSDFNGEESSYDSLSQTVEAFQDDFRGSPRLILAHFLPIVPDTDGFTQKYYNDWLITWETLFTIATDNFLLAVPGSRNNSP
ncbi:hypothetical protein PSTT_15576 [Puccinia striiformis]|uniref:Uncharacterized protein n=1 Tax=Puccinia striiformis TaxID=27350 RepID=A0A2S4UHD4_9BASI|nr:hypothetical protein PSTT_15576 [Puccinia striiformis]